MNGLASLEELVPIVDQAVDGVMRRRRKNREFVDDFRGWVMVKIFERDAARLRGFRGESSMLTYLRVVVDRLYCDYLVSLNGKWRPSRRAEERGPDVAMLERLVYRDGYTLEQAVATVQCRERERDIGEGELRDRFLQVPVRPRRCFVGLDCVSEPRADNRTSAYAILRQREIDEVSGVVRDTLVQALAELRQEDRRMLELRFRDGLRFSEIARRLSIPPRVVYRRFQRIFRVLRKKLEARGVLRHVIRDLTEGLFPPQEIEGAFARASARSESNGRKPTPALGARPHGAHQRSESVSLSV